MIKRLIANLFDEVIVVGVSLIVLGLAILILKLLGFKLSEQFMIAVIIAGVVNLLYYPIVEKIFNKTLGKIILRVE